MFDGSRVGSIVRIRPFGPRSRFSGGSARNHHQLPSSDQWGGSATSFTTPYEAPMLCKSVFMPVRGRRRDRDNGSGAVGDRKIAAPGDRHIDCSALRVSAHKHSGMFHIESIRTNHCLGCCLRRCGVNVSGVVAMSPGDFDTAHPWNRVRRRAVGDFPCPVHKVRPLGRPVRENVLWRDTCSRRQQRTG